jgi:hypothetical protein
MPVSFSKAGVRSAHAMARHLGDRVHMVSDVHIELRRLSQRLPALAKLLRGWPPNPVRELDLHLKGEVAAAIKARQVPGQHPDEDRGEVASVFYAASRREAGESFEIITDDGYGKKLARDRDLALVTTADLALEMVQMDALSHVDGKRVWRQCVGRSRWKDFDGALAQRRASG